MAKRESWAFLPTSPVRINMGGCQHEIVVTDVQLTLDRDRDLRYTISGIGGPISLKFAEPDKDVDENAFREHLLKLRDKLGNQS